MYQKWEYVSASAPVMKCLLPYDNNSLIVYRCKTCGEYIYKGKKFNARKETVQNQLYMGLPIFRFYIKCTRCLAEITFKVSSSRNVAMWQRWRATLKMFRAWFQTDPENTDYAMEHGATRNFQAEKLIEEEEQRIQQEREDEELNNPMKVSACKNHNN